MNKSDNIKKSNILEQSQFLLYTTENGKINVNVVLKDETIWLTQKSIADLFGVNIPAISKHLANIFSSGELIEDSVISILETTAEDGKQYRVKFYNLDAIISVGYRVNSVQATQFRVWATQILKEFVIKGFTLDDERLKQGNNLFDKDYFRELLERIRSIRASERRIYQQITDVFAECSIDYNPNSEITKTFFASVQNKFHYAITGETAAEIVFNNANSNRENMGLSTWKNSPNGRILKSDTVIAKNYLKEEDIKLLERTVSGYFDYIEGLIVRRQTFTMESLANSVNKFLDFNEYKVLEGRGRVTNLRAKRKAITEYEQFNKTQKILSDFDKQVLKLSKKSKKL